MPKLNYPLKTYIKVVKSIATEKGLSSVKVTPAKGSVVRFELFEKNMNIPMSIWVIHHTHNNKKEIWSKDDYRKAARNLGCDYLTFLEKFKTLK